MLINSLLSMYLNIHNGWKVSVLMDNVGFGKIMYLLMLRAEYLSSEIS